MSRRLNTFCNMTDSTLKLEEHRISLESRQDAASDEKGNP